MAESNRSPQIPINEFVGIKQANLFHTLKHPQFTGQLVFGSVYKEEWTFFLYLGRIMYATGGKHPIRRWIRNIKEVKPSLLDKLSSLDSRLLNSEKFQQYWEYELLSYWLNEGIVSRQDFGHIIRNMAVEILFDVSQRMEIVFQLSENQPLSTPLIFINPDQVITKSSEMWEQWEDAKLSSFYPNDCPVIVDAEKLQGRISEQSYVTMSKLFNGQNTIRDISLQINQDIISVSRSILPHLESGLIQLIYTSDLPCPIAF